ncbi:MAG: hypothetical protein R3F61_15870 [Myxococcota bacterium]
MIFVPLLLTACGVRLPDPVVQSVEPNRGWNGEETVITLEGGNFYPQVEFNANRRDEADLDVGFTASLRSEVSGVYPLGGVSALDYEHIRAVVSPGLPSGVYDVVVVAPSGSEAVLAAAYTVSDTRADRLDIASDGVVAEVNTPELLTIRLLAPGGSDEIVQSDLEVEVRVEAVGGGAVDGAFSTSDLENVILAPNRQSLTGFLGPDGVGRVSLSVGTPGQVDVSVRPLDPTSPIRSGTTRLQWEPGQDLTAIIELPASPSPFEVTAGQPFDVEVRLEDQFGNPVDDDVLIVLQSSCSPVTRILEGPETVQVALFASTVLGNACSDAPQTLRVIAGPPGESEPITVLPGPLSNFGVVTSSVPIRAGETKSADITPRDAYGNSTPFTGALTIDDSLGGVQATDCIPTGFNDVNCRFISTRAAPQVQLLVGAGSITGQSAPYEVRPALVVDALSIEVLDASVAGEPVRVGLSPLDVYGNLIGAGDLASAAISLTDELDEAACEPTTPLADGRYALACTLTTARPDAVLSAVVDGVPATSPPFGVVNGPLADATVVAPASVVAGDTFSVGVTATDAFGNPYVVQSTTVVDLVDPSGTVLETVSLDATGAGTAPVRLTVSGTTMLSVADTDVLGSSGPIVVHPDVGVGLVVRPLVPWAFTGVATAVRVESVDQFGNRGAESFPATLSSRSGSGPTVAVSIVNGAATTTFSWATPRLDEVLDASGGGLSGESLELSVVADCGANGPTAVLDFAGAPQGRACWDDSSQSASLAGSLASSTPGTAPLLRYASSVEGGAAVITSGPGFGLVIEQQGPSAVSALVADTSACGDVVSSTVWVGLDDGNPVGAIPVTLDSGVAVVGLEALDVDVVGAVDCTGDPAAGGLVTVRTNRGALVGPVPTGSGLELQLDATGSASFLLDARPAFTGGTADLVVASVSGGGRAELAAQFTGDDRMPWVYDQGPIGDTSGLIDHIDLTFSEPMLAASMVPAAFQVVGPVSVAVTSVTELAPVEWRVGLDAPIDASAGTWTLRATDDVRDLAGNRLDGAYTGVSADWVGTFGALPSSADPVVCAPATPRFRPDGDPGVGEESDTFVVGLTTASLPAWWVASVLDPSGDVLLKRRVVPVGVSDSWVWDGRDVTERIVDDGVYSVVLEPEDGLGNLGPGCVVSVEVANGESP